MKILFNHNNNGGQELKQLLGFLDADLDYNNLETDIELNTPDLLRFVGQPVYDKLLAHYESGDEDQALDQALKNAQLYVLLKAYLEYASNGDILHGNTGRKIHFADNQKTPWDWQIRMDNGALERRAYKALDQLIDILDASNIIEWTESEPYRKARSLFLFNTQQLQNIYPINHSSQLYYRLVPFMGDIENETLIPILGLQKYEQLKAQLKSDPVPEDQQLIGACQKITAFHVLERASVLLPEEMFGVQINYKLNDQEREVTKEKRAMRFLAFAKRHELELERLLSRQNAESFDLDPLHGIQPNKKHVNL